MNYTKEQKIEMLKEIWQEGNLKYCDMMAKEEYVEARKALAVMEWSSGLQSFLEE